MPLAYLFFFTFLNCLGFWFWFCRCSAIPVQKALLPMTVNPHLCFPNHLGSSDSGSEQNISEDTAGGPGQTEEKTPRPCECSASSFFFPSSSPLFIVLFSFDQWLEWLITGGKIQTMFYPKGVAGVPHKPILDFTVSSTLWSWQAPLQGAVCVSWYLLIESTN